jgi:AraC-like DNA-binding protein
MAKQLYSESGALVSMALVRHMLDLTAWQGQPAAPILEAAGLTPADIDDPEGWLPVEYGGRMIRAVLERSQDPQFYLRLSQLTFLSGYGIVGYLLESSPTLQDAILSLMRYERLISTVTFSQLEHQPGRALWTFECRHDDPVVVRHMTEFHTGCRYLFMHMVKERRSRIVSEVHFRHEGPASAQEADAYEQVFRCPVRFGQPRSALVLQPASLALPLRQVEFGIKAMLEAHADRKLREMMEAQGSPLAQARAQLRVLVLGGQPTRERLAERLGMSARHLHRLLLAEGSSYRDLLDELRLELAREQLRQSARTIEEIGHQLGFTEGQSFTRWFRRHTGQAPRDFRQAPAEPA